ncbi:MAG TPA: endonuclease [Bacteroidales bacterium]|nr:endonuclease [Bacteroidales bacterium]
MAKITDSPSKSIQDELDALSKDLNEKVSKKSKNNVLIATWNIRKFGDLTEEWVWKPNMKPKRDLHALRCIVEIIKRFDIIAVQEVIGNLKCLRETMRYLGDDWSFLMTDITKGKAGNKERLAFIFNNKKVKLSGLACEIVIPDEELNKGVIKSDALSRQFARTPYAVSFKVGSKTFVLLTLHVIFGEIEARVPELKAIAEWVKEWAVELKGWGHSLIVMGDFNIERKDDKLFKAFTSTGLSAPPELNEAARSIFNKLAFYDQIAWFQETKKNNTTIDTINLKYKAGGNYDFTAKSMTSLKLPLKELSYRISDHFPLWIEFEL